jgi:glycerol-3-phosphate acyltransferase PlsY
MAWLLAIFAYLLGSVSFAVLLSQMFHLSDPRTSGSGNPGTTNMLRLGGKRLAILTLLGDLSKSLIPILLARLLDLTETEQAWIGLAAVLGHVYPLYFQFRGGKGIATAAGMLLGLYPWAALLAAGIWGAVFALTRTSSLAALVATVLCMPLVAWQQSTVFLPVLVLTILIFIRHRTNLKALLSGQERRF